MSIANFATLFNTKKIGGNRSTTYANSHEKRFQEPNTDFVEVVFVVICSIFKKCYLVNTTAALNKLAIPTVMFWR